MLRRLILGASGGRGSFSKTSSVVALGRRPVDAADKDFDEPILPLGYVALFSTRLIIDFKAIPKPRQFAPR